MRLGRGCLQKEGDSRNIPSTSFILQIASFSKLISNRFLVFVQAVQYLGFGEDLWARLSMLAEPGFH